MPRLGVAGQQIVYHHPSAVLGVESDHTGRIVFSDATGVYRLSTAPAATLTQAPARQGR
jgi:hypothetical protein